MKTAISFRFTITNFLCVIKTQFSNYKSRKSGIWAFSKCINYTVTTVVHTDRQNLITGISYFTQSLPPWNFISRMKHHFTSGIILWCNKHWNCKYNFWKKLSLMLLETFGFFMCNFFFFSKSHLKQKPVNSAPAWLYHSTFPKSKNQEWRSKKIAV